MSTTAHGKQCCIILEAVRGCAFRGGVPTPKNIHTIRIHTHRTHQDNDDPVEQLQARCAAHAASPASATTAQTQLATSVDHLVEQLHTINAHAAQLVQTYRNEVHAWVGVAQQQQQLEVDDAGALDASGVLATVHALQAEVDAAAEAAGAYEQLKQLHVPGIKRPSALPSTLGGAAPRAHLPAHLTPPISSIL